MLEMENETDSLSNEVQQRGEMQRMHILEWLILQRQL